MARDLLRFASESSTSKTSRHPTGKRSSRSSSSSSNSRSCSSTDSAHLCPSHGHGGSAVAEVAEVEQLQTVHFSEEVHKEREQRVASGGSGSGSGSVRETTSSTSTSTSRLSGMGMCLVEKRLDNMEQAAWLVSRVEQHRRRWGAIGSSSSSSNSSIKSQAQAEVVSDGGSAGGVWLPSSAGGAAAWPEATTLAQYQCDLELGGGGSSSAESISTSVSPTSVAAPAFVNESPLPQAAEAIEQTESRTPWRSHVVYTIRVRKVCCRTGRLVSTGTLTIVETAVSEWSRVCET